VQRNALGLDGLYIEFQPEVSVRARARETP